MSNLLIKLATDKECEAISGLLSEAFQEFKILYSKEAFSATVISPAEVCKRILEGPLWVAEFQGKLVGTVSLLPGKNEMYLRGMVVLPAAQGLKIGLALLQKAGHFALDNHCKRLFLRTTPYLEKAINLYEGFGFRRMDTGQEDFYGTPSFLMEKKFLQMIQNFFLLNLCRPPDGKIRLFTFLKPFPFHTSK